MRGLKLVTMYAKVNNIESHLLQMRGLKRLILNLIISVIVASFTDAWIETEERKKAQQQLDVASFTDAWIETYATCQEQNS